MPGATKPEDAVNHRNGASGKTVLTEDGPLRIDGPRDRHDSFEPLLIPKHDRRFTGFDDKIVAMYARGMTVREIQGFLAEQCATEVAPDWAQQSGARSSEIARTLGKSRGYLTFIGALIDPPAWLLDLYCSGRCRGISELYELRKLHESQPEAVAQWIEGRPDVSRADVQAFKERLPAVAQAEPLPPHVPVQPDPAAQPGLAAAQSPDPSAHSGVSAPSTPIVIAEASKQLSRTVALLGEVDGVQVRVLLDAKVEGVDCVAVCAVESAKRWNVAASSIDCLRLEVLAIPAGRPPVDPGRFV